jgi:hypothetical protein
MTVHPNRLGDTFGTDEWGVGGIKDEDGTTLLAENNQFFQLDLGGGSSSRVAVK